MDFSSLWSWTVPLWGLFLIVLFLGGVLSERVVLVGEPAKGGARESSEKRKVRFSLPTGKSRDAK